MKGSTLLPFSLLLITATSSVSGLKIPFKRQDPSVKATFGVTNGSNTTLVQAGNNAKGNVGNIQDLRYTATVQLNGQDVVLALDTGSSDLWVYYPDGFKGVNDTQLSAEIMYGDGSYGVKGTIALAPLEFGPYKVPAQAFLDVKEITVKSLAELGINGLLGLGFNGTQASRINAAILHEYGNDATWGQPFLTNIFLQNTSTPNFIAIDLSRTDDLEDTSGGTFDIGEYDTRYTAIQNSPKLPVFPEGAESWQTLLDEIKVDGKSIPLISGVNGVPNGKAVAALDTGTPTSAFTTAIVSAIYHSIPGAVYDEDIPAWILPCNATSSVEFIFEGGSFPMHPLDLSTPQEFAVLDKKYTACFGSFMANDGWSATYDFLLGDSFLRNTYTSYDFGDFVDEKTLKRGAPYMQLLAQTNPEKAANETIVTRAKTLSQMAPEISPQDLLELTRSLSGNINGNPGGSSSSTVNAQGLSKGDWDEIKRYALAGFGLLALNVAIGLVLLVVSCLGCIRRRGKSLDSAGKPQYVPVSVKSAESGYGPY